MDADNFDFDKETKGLLERLDELLIEGMTEEQALVVMEDEGFDIEIYKEFNEEYEDLIEIESQSDEKLDRETLDRRVAVYFLKHWNGDSVGPHSSTLAVFYPIAFPADQIKVTYSSYEPGEFERCDEAWRKGIWKNRKTTWDQEKHATDHFVAFQKRRRDKSQ